jgi:methylglutaconyl-CoA hydratase
MEPDYQNLRLSVDPRGVATITLHRPDKHNALDDRLIAELREAARRVDGDDSIRVTVLTGAGKSFCAGGDIGWFSRNLSLTRAQRIQQSAELAGMLRDLDHLNKPLIGRINGAAFGGGVGMISVCDIAVGVEQARFALTEVRLGLVPANISPYVVARMGAANCRATMLSGESFDARRAVSMGLLNEVVPDGMLDQRMDRLVAQHLQGAPGAVAATKRLIREVAGRAVEDSMALTAERLADAWESPEGRIGVESFLNRTCPPWRDES